MIAFTSITLNNNGSWTFAWANQGASFYRVVLNGVQIAKVTTLTYTYTPSNSNYYTYPPPLEIANGSQLVLSEQYQPYLLIQWYYEPGVAYYQVQQLVNGNWIAVTNIAETGSWVYSYQTPTEVDQQTYTYQVVAIDGLGNLSTPRQYIQNVACPPAPVDASVFVGYNKPNITVHS